MWVDEPGKILGVFTIYWDFYTADDVVLDPWTPLNIEASDKKEKLIASVAYIWFEKDQVLLTF